MPRPPREDAPDTYHHITNRGLAHRAVFESRADFRMFLALVARAVRSGAIELLAYCILQTHYHLFVRSVRGELSATMQRIQNQYVRWFNRTRDRDGPLFKGRFYSRRVDSEIYERILVRYIDENPCGAGLATLSYEYPYGSAHSFVYRAGPRWLSRGLVESLVRASTRVEYSPDGYVQVFGRPLDEEGRAHLRRAVEAPEDPQVAIEDLARASPAHVRAWLRERARLADGGGSGPAVILPRELLRAVHGWISNPSSDLGNASGDPGAELSAALLSECCGLTQEEIAKVLGTSRAFVSKACRTHRRRVGMSEEYGRVCGEIVSASIATGHARVWLGSRFQPQAGRQERGT